MFLVGHRVLRGQEEPDLSAKSPAISASQILKTFATFPDTVLPITWVFGAVLAAISIIFMICSARTRHGTIRLRRHDPAAVVLGGGQSCEGLQAPQCSARGCRPRFAALKLVAFSSSAGRAGKSGPRWDLATRGGRAPVILGDQFQSAQKASGLPRERD